MTYLSGLTTDFLAAVIYICSIFCEKWPWSNFQEKHKMQEAPKPPVYCIRVARAYQYELSS